MMMFSYKWAGFLVMFVLCQQSIASAKDSLVWPQNQMLAVSLSYDDNLASQLDVAIPALDKYKFKASFYLTLSSTLTQTRLSQWRKASSNGHELGNHTIVHSCRASLSNRQWVTPEHDLDDYTLTRIIEEVDNANRFLYAIDGQSERTFTPPCGDMLVDNKNYLMAIKSKFLGFKLWPQITKPGFKKLLIADNVSAEDMIQFIDEAKGKEKLVHILFHGIGADHMSITVKEHQKLLDYLHENRDVFYVDSYINIIRYAKSEGHFFQDLSSLDRVEQ